MLSVDTLTNDIQLIFNKKLNDINQIATELSVAYKNYTLLSQGALFEPFIFTGLEVYKLQSAFLSLMRGRYPAGLASSSVGFGLQQYWLAPPILTAGTGIVTAILIEAGISQMANVHVNTLDSAARSLAEALHNITKTVFITYPFPLPPGFIK